MLALLRIEKRGRTVAPFGLLAFVMVGCGVGSEESLPASTSVNQWDSAGVQVVQSSGETLRTSLGWILDSVPDLEIGSIYGEESYQFSMISSVGVLPQGEIVVTEGMRPRIRWFDSTGTFLRAAGREGSGPGEFRSTRVIPQFQTDSLVVFDNRERRLTSVSRDARELRTQPGGDVDRLLLGGLPLLAGANRVVFRSGDGRCPSADGVCEQNLYVHVLNPGAATSDTVAVSTQRIVRITESGMTSILDIPFDPVVSAAPTAEGFVVSTGEEFEIRAFGMDGTLQRIIRLDLPPLALEEEELEGAILRFPRGAFGLNAVRRWFDQMEIRDKKPAFQALQVDPLGWVWAELFRADESSPGEWLVFDPSGQARGLVTMPQGLTVYHVGERFVLGVATDDMGVPYVRRYSLDRGTS